MINVFLTHIFYQSQAIIHAFLIVLYTQNYVHHI